MTESTSLEFARTEAEEIRRLLGKTAEHLLEVGRRLIDVKATLNHGEWGDYLRREFDWNERTAQRFMNVAERFKNDNLSDLNIAPSALYLLSAPSTPDEVRGEIIDRARTGERITHGAAKAAIQASKLPVLEIDPEFSNIYPPIDPKRYALMEKSIVEQGVIVPLKAWRGILLDGHIRYEICRKHSIPFEVEEVDLPDRAAARRYIYSINMRANYSEDQLAMICVHLEEHLESEQANSAD